MSFWKKMKQTTIANRLIEEKLYEQVLHEFESGVRRDGLWAKAFQKSNGDVQKANALYIEYRVQSIKDEAEMTAMLAERYEEERARTYVKPNHQFIENNKPGTSDTHADIKTRVLCSDGTCIGVIGKNGRCKDCGKPYTGNPDDSEHEDFGFKCKTCGFIVFGDDPAKAKNKKCLGCGNIMGDEPVKQ